MSCHRPGASGPFSLRTYDEVKPRADLIRNVTILQKMPPVLAESDFGTFAKEKRLTPAETVAIQEWVRLGAPEGTGKSESVGTVEAWPMGKPDLILKNSRRIVVSAEGAEAVRTSTVEVPMTIGGDLIAFDFRPNAPQTARQAVLAFESEGNPFAPTGYVDKSLIGAWAIGCNVWRLPEGAGLRLEPGTKLKIRILYHPTGKYEDGGFQLGLYFSTTARSHSPSWITVGSRDFQISGQPPAYLELMANQKLGRAVRVVSVLPEARSLAKKRHFERQARRGMATGFATHFPLGSAMAGGLQLRQSTPRDAKHFSRSPNLL
jgi:hypothetical protein